VLDIVMKNNRKHWLVSYSSRSMNHWLAFYCFLVAGWHGKAWSGYPPSWSCSPSSSHMMLLRSLRWMPKSYICWIF